MERTEILTVEPATPALVEAQTFRRVSEGFAARQAMRRADAVAAGDSAALSEGATPDAAAALAQDIPAMLGHHRDPGAYKCAAADGQVGRFLLAVSDDEIDAALGWG